MKTLDLPFNVDIMRLDQSKLQLMRPVKSLDFFENVNGDFHEDGLFSVAIFGRVGEEMRDKRFSYIDIKTEIFHPVIYSKLIQVRGLYRGILAGTAYAKWNPELRDFETADELSGETGYAFFLRHWKEIKFVRNRSDVRDMRIKLLEKYRNNATVDKILVMPAGLRDLDVGEDGRTVVDDINTYYRKILSISKTIADTDYARSSAAYNLPRHLLQMTFNDIFDNIEKMLTGKKGFLQYKWGSRRIFNGTRNVITAMDTSVEVLGGPNAQRYTDTVVGLHQLTKALLPVTIHRLKTTYLQQVFAPGNGYANLVDPTTLKSQQVLLNTDTYDRWTTVEGLEKVVSSYGEVSFRHKPILLDGRYLALIYVGPDKTFRIFNDIDELPSNLSRKHVRPINLVELLYLCGYRVWNNYVAFVTRYPITGTGSCFPATIYTKTTIVGEVRQELDESWQPIPDAIANEFPTYEPLAYLDSHVIQSSRLAGLGADQSLFNRTSPHSR